MQALEGTGEKRARSEIHQVILPALLFTESQGKQQAEHLGAPCILKRGPKLLVTWTG